MAKKKKETQNDYSIILDDIIFSYSSVDGFSICPLCFYMQYIKCLPSSPGAFGQFGGFCHDILENYAKGKLEVFELSKKYKDDFEKVVSCPFPPNKYVDLKEKYYEEGLNFFDNFEGYDDVKIIGIENKYDFKVGKYNFTGKVDLETEGKIIDYKTKKASHLERLTKKHNKEEYITMTDGRFIKFDDFIQLLLYSIPYKEKHKKYPDFLVLDLIKANDKYIIKFEEPLLHRAIKWVEKKIQEIYNTKEFKKGEDLDNFWCDWICGQRYNCQHSSRYTE